jgi:hypothetical protein
METATKTRMTVTNLAALSDKQQVSVSMGHAIHLLILRFMNQGCSEHHKAQLGLSTEIIANPTVTLRW